MLDAQRMDVSGLAFIGDGIRLSQGGQGAQGTRLHLAYVGNLTDPA